MEYRFAVDYSVHCHVFQVVRMRLLSLLRSVSSRSDIRSQVRCRCLYLASQTKLWSQENTANLSTNPTKPINELKVAQTGSDVSVEQTTSSGNIK